MTHFRSRSMLALSSVAVAALAVAGCSNTESEPTASSTAITSSTTTETDATARAAQDADGTLTDAPTGTTAQTEEASAEAALTITDIRVGHHEGFDRVVYELEGDGTPGWRAEIVPTATQQGSGDPLAVSGQGILQVLLDGAAMPFETGVDAYAGPNPLEVEKPVVVTEVRDAGVYEGVAQTLIGLSDREATYRIYTLSDPTRVVVDVAS